MSDIKLFNLKGNQVKELEAKSVTIEKSLQTLIEKHLEIFLGVKFLATEYSTGPKHGGRVDTLGLDENNCPVIIEYKRTTNANVVVQGLYYLDWLMDHKADYNALVKESHGNTIAENIEWDNARLICIAGDYTKFDSHAVDQMNRNIELIRYRKFKELLLFELINVTIEQPSETSGSQKRMRKYKTVAEYYKECNDELKNHFEEILQFTLNLGDGIQFKQLDRYFAFKKIKTFATMIFRPANNMIVMWVNADLSKVKLQKGFTRDVTNIGHHGIGNLEIKIKTNEDLENAKPFLIKSYEQS